MRQTAIAAQVTLTENLQLNATQSIFSAEVS